VRLKREL